MPEKGGGCGHPNTRKSRIEPGVGLQRPAVLPSGWSGAEEHRVHERVPPPLPVVP